MKRRRIFRLIVAVCFGVALISSAACTTENCRSGIDSCFSCTCDLIRDATTEHKHDMVHVNASEATCQYIGYKEHWYCNSCKKYFYDEAGTREYSGSVYIERKKHTMVLYEKVEPTCTSTGLERYWLCTQCNKTFLNSNGNYEETPKVIPMLKHDVISVAEEPYTCTENGVEAHYTCTLCHGLFADEAATQTVTDEELTIPAAHKFSTLLSYDDTQHWYNVMCEHEELVEKVDHDFSGEDPDKCTECLYVKPSEGLIYSVDGGGTAKLVSIGTCSRTKIKIADKYEGKPVTSIGEGAFADCTDVVNVDIPSTVTVIGDNAFLNCQSIVYIFMPTKLTSIGENAFKNCTALERFYVYSSLESIGSSAFYGCESLTSFRFGNSLTSIGDNAFYGCKKLTTVELSDNVTSIGNGAFKYCEGLTDLTIGSGVVTIGDEAFMCCNSLANVTLAEKSKLKSIGDKAFNTCMKMTGFAIPYGLESIGAQAFYSCPNLLRVDIPYSVTTIGSLAFSLPALQIYTSALTKPEGWASDWSGSSSVRWGYYGT